MKKNLSYRNSIALLATVFFIMVITFGLGLAIKNIKNSSESFKEEHFMIQSHVILNDVLNMLKNTQELKKIENAEDMRIFLDNFSTFYFEINSMKVAVEIQSARDRINPNSINTQKRKDSFRKFLNAHAVNTQYAEMLFDIMGGIKEDMTYNTDIFEQKPYLFRDYIVSRRHLEEISDSYLKKFHDNSLKNIDTDKLFYISKEQNTSIDLNYANKSTWEVLLGCDENRAKSLRDNAGKYKNINDLLLSQAEKNMLNRFKTSFFEPYLDVKIDIIQKNIHAHSMIGFEYDIRLKEGSNFVFEI